MAPKSTQLIWNRLQFKMVQNDSKICADFQNFAIVISWDLGLYYNNFTKFGVQTPLGVRDMTPKSEKMEFVQCNDRTDSKWYKNDSKKLTNMLKYVFEHYLLRLVFFFPVFEFLFLGWLWVNSLLGHVFEHFSSLRDFFSGMWFFFFFWVVLDIFFMELL